jgi:hypothetical protein
MANELIKCPECGAEFPISKAISHDIEITVAKKYEKQIKEVKDQTQQLLTSKEEELKTQFQKDKKRIEESARKEKEEALKELESERKQIEEQAKKKAQDTVSSEMANLKEELSEKNTKIAENQKIELELRKKQREVEERSQSLEIELNRKLDEERNKIIENAQKTFEEQHKLKDLEKNKKLSDLHKQVNDLKRKLEQGSQQMQGEVLELQIEEMLKQEFPFDNIEPVPKGIKGADAVQVVKTQSGKVCGKVLWESKRTKSWSDSWIQKAKDDQRAAKAHLVVIVSEILPDGVSQFVQINGVWVVGIPLALNLSKALRFMLLEVAREKSFQDGKAEKMEILYNYLTGPEFRNRLEAILEGFVTLKKDLDSEKRAMEKIWSKREKQIDKVIKSIGGMHGDLEGIAGPSLPVVKMLEFPSIDDKKSDNG